VGKPLHPQLQPFVPSAGDPWDAVKAAHLLQRAGFGGTAEEIEHVRQLGVEKAVDALMDFPDAPIDEIERDGGPDLSSIEGYPKNFAEQRRLFQGKTEDERMRLRQEQQRNNREAVAKTMGWWMERMAYGPYPLHEKLVLFWHGHFTTGANEERRAALIWQQNELHRRMAAGNFREYVRQISRDPAMLEYLNNAQNRKQAPNENYARELMELFTLGRGQYSENDIKEAARAFTGWGHDGDEFQFRERDHDTGIKQFMGRQGNFDGDDIIEIILQHKACAPYMAGRFVNYFAFETVETDADVLESLGNVLRENRWEVRPMLRTLLTSRLFYSQRAMGTQIKSPIQLVVGTIRMLDLQFPAFRLLQSQLNQMGQVPLAPPNVKGWPGGKLWINTSTLFVRYNTGVWLTGGEIPVLGDVQRAGAARNAGRRERLLAQRLGGVQLEVKPVDLDTPEQVADYWVRRLIQRPIASEKMQTLADSLDGQPRNAAAVKKMIQLIVSMPDYQLC
jgi:hypothetical protein